MAELLRVKCEVCGLELSAYDNVVLRKLVKTHLNDHAHQGGMLQLLLTRKPYHRSVTLRT